MNPRYPFLIVLLLTLAGLTGCNSVNTAALGANEVSVQIRDLLLFCTINAHTNLKQNCGEPSRYPEAVPGDICLKPGDEITFSSPTKRTNQFLIITQGPNPFKAISGNGACPNMSENGVLSCKFDPPVYDGAPDVYKYWIFGQGCSQALDPRIYVIRNR